MLDLLRQHIIERLGREPGRLEEVLACFVPRTTQRQEALVEVGSVCRQCFFIVQGCLQTATVNRHGDEQTIDLAFEGEWRTAIHSFVNQTPSQARLVSVEPGEVLVIGRDDFLRLAREVPEFETIYQRILEAAYTESQRRIQTLMGMDALERLRWLLAQHPLIFTRLPNKLIASYLGLSQATLSRLKTKL